MSLSEFETARIHKIFASFCEKRIPPHARSQVRLEYEIAGNGVILFEMRANYLDEDEWLRIDIARFEKNPETNVWSLYFSGLNNEWHLFEPYPEDKDIEQLLKEVSDDSVCVFWG